MTPSVIRIIDNRHPLVILGLQINLCNKRAAYIALTENPFIGPRKHLAARSALAASGALNSLTKLDLRYNDNPRRRGDCDLHRPGE